MIRTLYKSLNHNGRVRTIVNWNRAIDNIDLRMDVHRSRFNGTAIAFTPIVHKLRALLTQYEIPMDQMARFTSDFDRYSKGVVPIIDGLKANVNPIYNVGEPKNIVGKRMNNEDCFEIHVQTEPAKPFDLMPMDEPYQAWKALRSVRIWSHDSTELLYDLIPYQVTFHHDMPSLLVVTFDLHVLLMSFIKYYIERTRPGLTYMDLVDQYIHEDLLPLWYDDFIQTWLMNFIWAAIKSPVDIKVQTQRLCTHTSFLVTEASVESALKDLNTELSLVRSHHNRLEDFLSVPWFRGQSYFNLMETLMDDLTVLPLGQNAPVAMLLQLPVLRPVLFLLRELNTPVAQRMQMITRTKLYQFNLGQVQNLTKSSILSERLMAQVQELNALVTPV